MTHIEVYNAQQGKSVPAAEAAKYMDEDWLDEWCCLHTTCDWIAAWQQSQDRIAELDKTCQGYYDEAATGWEKFREAQSRIATLEASARHCDEQGATRSGA